MSNSTRSKGKISSVGSEPVRLNTLVSTSKQGNNSMASVQDSEDSNGEAEGSDNITGHEAPVPLKFGRKHTFPQDLPKFSGTESGWDKFKCEFLFLIKLLCGIDLSVIVRPGPDKLSPDMDSFIYHCLCRAIDDTSYYLICRHKNKGWDAFTFLDKSWSGSIKGYPSLLKMA